MNSREAADLITRSYSVGDAVQFRSSKSFLVLNASGLGVFAAAVTGDCIRVGDKHSH
jgi:hypothetical protein